MTKAFAYLRVSGKGQVEGDGFKRQLIAIEKYAKRQGIRIEKVFREEGISGANDLENRPALGDLYGALAANGTHLVLVENLQRLARDLMVQESLIASFQRKGWELVSVTEPDILEAEPSRVLMRQIFGAINQYEKAMIVSKLKGARQRMKDKEGRCEGRKPYGFYEGEQAVIDRILELRAQGLPLEAIASSLNATGIGQKPQPTRTGKLWSAVQVNRVIKRAKTR